MPDTLIIKHLSTYPCNLSSPFPLGVHQYTTTDRASSGRSIPQSPPPIINSTFDHARSRVGAIPRGAQVISQDVSGNVRIARCPMRSVATFRGVLACRSYSRQGSDGVDSTASRVAGCDIVKIHTLLPSDKTSREEERDDYIFFRESIEGIVQVVVQNLEQVVVIFNHHSHVQLHMSSYVHQLNVIPLREKAPIHPNQPSPLHRQAAPPPHPRYSRHDMRARPMRVLSRPPTNHCERQSQCRIRPGMREARGARVRRVRAICSAGYGGAWYISQIPQSHLHDLLFDLYGNNDGDLVDLQLQVVRIATLSKKLLAREGYSAQRLVCMEELCYNVDGRDEDGYVSTLLAFRLSSSLRPPLSCGPHDLLLHLLHKTGFDHTILLDFLISAETPSFLEFLLLYLRYLEHDLPAFRTCCAKLASKESESEEEKEREEDEDESEDEDKDEDVDMDEEEGAERAVVGRVVRVLARLRSAVGARGFPYNAASLVKRLTVVEGLLDEAGDHYGVSRSAAKH
ncbi:hypothetical protein BC936DRAFT_145299 [Jimgerdemannia flammicorona]|uniref:Protein Lines N-terminal domain-containing protein n=1 Tax=Jimgerdemannia flammicorona TaxID=994334 RepID=A0A433DAL6_9FUNG|nr:hypothetical protein BC936DRAFT_145299 [Jimgerdemannia flammicorona]